MAKHPETKNEQTQTQTPPATPPPAAPVATAPDERFRKLTLDEAGSVFAYGDNSKNGVTVNRIDFIRTAWTTGQKARGAIAKELTRLIGKKVTYQIVFSATKGTAGGPPAAVAAPAAQTSTEAAPQTNS